MNKTLTIAATTLLCLAPLCASAQTPATTPPVDEGARMEAEYRQACAAYERNDAHAVARLYDYLDDHPDTPHANRIHALIGSSYFFDGRYDEALALFNSVQPELLADTERDDVTYRKAVCYIEAGNLAEAAVWLETVNATTRRYHADCTYYLSYIRYSQQRYDEALAGFLSLQDNARYGERASVYIGEIYYHTAQYPQAVETLERYMTETGGTIPRETRYMLGMSYYHTAQYRQAIDLLGEVAATDGDALAQNAYLHIGLSYLQQGDKTRARMAFEQAAASSADAAVQEQAAYNYALSIHDTDYTAFGQSITAFESFLNRFPHSRYTDRVSSYLVEVYMNTRSYEEALQSIDRIANPGADILEAKQRILFQLGTQAFANGGYTEAIDYFNRAAAQRPSNQQTAADAIYWRGETYYRQGRSDEAARDFNTYLRTTPDKAGETFALAYYNLGYIAFHNRSYTQAQSHFQRFIQLEKGGNPTALSDACNRLGDCYLEARRYEDAKACYNRAEAMNTETGDYSLYQLALVAGLQKDYDGKVALLSRMETRYPRSPYVVNSLYEKGRSYVQSGNNARAIATFRTLLSKYPASPVSRKAAAEVGLLYYQDGDYNRAIEAYRGVIEQYPGSEEARLALRDLRAIYVDANRVDEYAALAATLPGAERLGVGQQDTLTYLAAERLVQRGDLTNGETGLQRYLESYPNGAFVEEALVMHSEMLFNRKQYAEAMTDYKTLLTRATTAERRQQAATGWMRCAVLLKADNDIIDAATSLLGESKLTPELTQEARYYRGKAYLNVGNTHQAVADLRTAAEDTRTPYGAEARYLVAEQLYRQGAYADAEKELLGFIEQSTPHAYWLARSFVLLSDVYVATDRKLDARQYLLSLQQNYHADDDIAAMIDERLKNLSNP
jgi:TolA-binding protein